MGREQRGLADSWRSHFKQQEPTASGLCGGKSLHAACVQGHQAVVTAVVTSLWPDW